MKKALIIFTFLTISRAIAQISPPGLGRTANCDVWLALGLREDLDTTGNKRSLTYLGLGRQSLPTDFNPVERQAILVFNEEFYHNFGTHWQYSLGISYRRQNEFQEATVPSNTVSKNEIRLYGRYMFFQAIGRSKFAATFRQEFRRFYIQHFHNWKEDLQWRARLKLQYIIHLSARKTHRLTAGSEWLFKLSHSTISDQWSAFHYDETRLTFFYTYAPADGNLIYSIGYMDDVIGLKNVSYLTFDVVIKNPFSRLKKTFARDKSFVD